MLPVLLKFGTQSCLTFLHVANYDSFYFGKFPGGWFGSTLVARHYGGSRDFSLITKLITKNYLCFLHLVR